MNTRPLVLRGCADVAALPGFDAGAAGISSIHDAIIIAVFAHKTAEAKQAEQTKPTMVVVPWLIGNVVKHSEAKNITIELDMLEGRAVLAVSDDGNGFDATAKSKGMGLNNMRYRAGVIGAELQLARRKRGGTRVRCRLPSSKRRPR